MQTQAVKLKEVWRNPNGSFAPAPEPPKPKEEPKKEDGNVIIGLVLLGMSALVLLFILWQLTLSVLGVAAVRYGFLKVQEYRERQPLVINYYV